MKHLRNGNSKIFDVNLEVKFLHNIFDCLHGKCELSIAIKTLFVLNFINIIPFII